MGSGYASSLEHSKQMYLAASLLDKGDVIPALWCLDCELSSACRDAVELVLPVLSRAGLITDISLLPLPKPLLKAAIKLCILSCFAAGRQWDEKVLSNLYCQLAHFQDIARTGITVFDGLGDLAGRTAVGTRPGDRGAGLAQVEDRASWCARTLHRVADEFSGNAREMDILLARLCQLRQARAGSQIPAWLTRPSLQATDAPKTVQ